MLVAAAHQRRRSRIKDKHTPRLQISNLIGDGKFYSLRLIDEMKKNLCAKCNAGLIADFAKQTGITFD